MKTHHWLLTLFCLVIGVIPASGQKYVSERGQVSFFSDAALEDIKATNQKAISILNVATNDIAFSITVKDFHFDQSLMEEHFNEKYMESDKYPKATFQGKVKGLDASVMSVVQEVKASGKLTIHGITREVEIPGTLQNLDGKWFLKSKFKVKLEDYKIDIPKLLWEKIAEEVDVAIDFSYKAG